VRSIKQVAWVLWLIIWRIGCIGFILLGSLGALTFGVTIALRFLRPASFPEISVPMAAFALILAILSVVIGIKGLRIKSLSDVTTEIEALGSRREELERWINK
jgi:hypothetical protein